MSVRGTRQGRNVYRRRQQGERFQGSLATGSCQLITNWLGRDLWQALAQLDQSLSTRCTAAGGLAEAYNSQHPRLSFTLGTLVPKGGRLRPLTLCICVTREGVEASSCPAFPARCLQNWAGGWSLRAGPRQDDRFPGDGEDGAGQVCGSMDLSVVPCGPSQVPFGACLSPQDNPGSSPWGQRSRPCWLVVRSLGL